MPARVIPNPQVVIVVVAAVVVVVDIVVINLVVIVIIVVVVIIVVIVIVVVIVIIVVIMNGYRNATKFPIQWLHCLSTQFFDCLRRCNFSRLNQKH